MKKVIRFLCLLLVVALIAILVLKNGAKAGNGMNLTVDNNNISKNDEIEVKIDFGKNVSSFNGNITTTGDGSIKLSSGTAIISGSTIENFEGVAKQTYTFNAKGVDAGDCTIELDLQQVVVENEGEIQANDSITIHVQDDEPQPEPSISIGVNPSRIEKGATAQVSISSIEPESDRDSVTYSVEPEGIVSISGDGTVTAISTGTATITASTQSGAQSTASIEVFENNIPPQPTEFTASPNNITTAGTTEVTVTGGNVGSVSSSNESVATASNSGDGKVQVNVIGPGSATITITKEGSSDTATVTVNVENPDPGPGPGPTPEAQTPVLSPGKTTLTVNGDTTTITSNIPVTWKSGDSSIVAISADSSDTAATIISGKAGTTEITGTALDGGKTATVTITVKQNEQAAPIITTAPNIKIEVGKSTFVTANQSVTWSSSNPDIATVNAEGLVIGKGVGEVKITAKNSGGKTASVSVTVVAPQGGGSNEGGNSNIEDPNDKDTDKPIESTSTFAISPRNTQTLNIGDTLQIKVTKGTATSWKSSKPAVASVDSNGKVTANSSGITYITAVASDGSVAQLKIKVKDENGNDPEPGSEADNNVPSTGEASTSLLLVVGALTFIIATFIFRKKTK